MAADLLDEDLIANSLNNLLIAMYELPSDEMPMLGEIISFGDIAKMPLISRRQLMMNKVVSDGVPGALWAGVWLIGEYIYDRGLGTEGMLRIAERAAQLDGACYDFKMMAVDRCWDGIGKSSDMWAA